MMGRPHKLPEMAKDLFENLLCSESSKSWRSSQGMKIEMFDMAQSEAMSEDLEVWRKMPGWVVLGQDEDDALLCLEVKTGRCALVAVDELSSSSAQEISKSIQDFLSLGTWEKK